MRAARPLRPRPASRRAAGAAAGPGRGWARLRGGLATGLRAARDRPGRGWAARISPGGAGPARLDGQFPARRGSQPGARGHLRFRDVTRAIQATVARPRRRALGRRRARAGRGAGVGTRPQRALASRLEATRPRASSGHWVARPRRSAVAGRAAGRGGGSAGSLRSPSEAGAYPLFGGCNSASRPSSVLASKTLLPPRICPRAGGRPGSRRWLKACPRSRP